MDGGLPQSRALESKCHFTHFFVYFSIQWHGGAIQSRSAAVVIGQEALSRGGGNVADTKVDF
jgi:hypothetical protein